jgi:ribosomal 50S subunit-recycling heat shock protein
MRLDKFLQVSRLIRRRTLANQLCDGGHVQRDGRALRASAEVHPGDQLDVDYGWRKLRVEVLEVPPGPVPKMVAASLYRLIHEERVAPEPPDDREG